MEAMHDFAAALLAAAPELGTQMVAAGDDPRPDAELPGLWPGRAGAAIVACLPTLGDPARQRVFEVVEQHLVSGPEPVRSAVATGLLEQVASALSSGRADPALVARLLGPQSRAYLDAWDDFTLGRSSLEPPAAEQGRPGRLGRWRRWRRG
ncbi:hypothetical protein [Nocardioides ferulae]|uniref:hypothetical protein n=1 Tax=Nocardioides ferulae TaxID=2340821 RepID=UPI000EB2BF82|nr:hypothetical protein [Nocardioides ferulae]